jgi:hypothetical protein
MSAARGMQKGDLEEGNVLGFGASVTHSNVDRLKGNT